MKTWLDSQSMDKRKLRHFIVLSHFLYRNTGISPHTPHEFRSILVGCFCVCFSPLFHCIERKRVHVTQLELCRIRANALSLTLPNNNKQPAVLLLDTWRIFERRTIHIEPVRMKQTQNSKQNDNNSNQRMYSMSIWVDIIFYISVYGW